MPSMAEFWRKQEQKLRDSPPESQRSNYELYVCSRDNGCWTLKEFRATDDDTAIQMAKFFADKHENQTGDFIYREYLMRDGVEIVY